MKNFVIRFWWLAGGIAGIAVIELLGRIYPIILVMLLMPTFPIIFLVEKTFLYVPASLLINFGMPFLIGVIIAAIVRSIIKERKEVTAQSTKAKLSPQTARLPILLCATEIILTILYAFAYAMDGGSWHSNQTFFVIMIITIPLAILVSIINTVLSLARIFTSRGVNTRIILIVCIIVSIYFAYYQLPVAKFLEPIFNRVIPPLRYW